MMVAPRLTFADPVLAGNFLEAFTFQVMLE
jgi:hypothetical protein